VALVPQREFGIEAQRKRCTSAVGLQQREPAKLADLDVTTINRMEASGTGPVKGMGVNIQKVLDALERKR
jgi:hypothetical protein